ncbi:MAG TPA: hypothetical protein DCP69_04295 [Candidatus Omnitrophica bacterium]|nr:hypothetical protein [Candidatus Omnitrophota bacterium]
MATSVTLQAIVHQPDGGVQLKWSDGIVQYFNSMDEVKAIGNGFDDPNQHGFGNASMLLIKWWLARSPAGTNESLVLGKTLTLNLSAAAPIKVQ